jgi:hypothetical protein
VLKRCLAFAPAGVPGTPDRVLHSPLPFCGRLRGHVLLGRLRTLLYERGLPRCLWRFGGCLVAIGLGTSVGTDCAVNSCGDRMRWYELALKSVCRAYIVVRFGSSPIPGPPALRLPSPGLVLRFGSMRVPPPQGMVGAVRMLSAVCLLGFEQQGVVAIESVACVLHLLSGISIPSCLIVSSTCARGEKMIIIRSYDN